MGMNPVGCSLCRRRGAKYRARIVPEHVQPAGNICCVVRTWRIAQTKVGHQEAGADLGNKLFAGPDGQILALVPKRFAGEERRAARRMTDLIDRKRVAKEQSVSDRLGLGFLL